MGRHKKRRIPKLVFAKLCGIGWHVNFRAPVTRSPRRVKFGAVEKNKAHELYRYWHLDYVNGKVNGGSSQPGAVTHTLFMPEACFLLSGPRCIVVGYLTKHGMTDATSYSPDPTLLELFRAEVDLHLPVLSNGLLALEKQEADPKQIASMMRAAHSIKGAARIVGNEPAVRVSHALEDCLTSAKDGRIVLGSETIDVLLQAVDTLARVCTADSAAGPDDAGMASMLDRLSSVRDGRTIAPAAVASDESAEPVSICADELLSPTVLGSPPSESIAIPADWEPVAAEAFRSRLCAVLQNPPRNVRLDFSGVGRANVQLMAVLLSFFREVKKFQPPPHVEAACVAPAIRALLRAVGLEAAFETVS